MGTPKRPVRKQLSKRQAAVKHGWRSGLEEEVAKELDDKGVAYEYEKLTLHYTVPAKNHKYTPDFELLSNGIVVETKGRFVTSDRQKHLLIKAQHPNIDIRFVFSNPNQRISKLSRTTYGMWCDKNGFKWAARSVPDEWLKEQPK
ncbi:MAG: endodeoxyribonuclease [Dehalococcoidia bacterium]|jgi:hypothetical protein|nr:MAG: endodeoxyribonuclease [Dehalococcoidia bacterium]